MQPQSKSRIVLYKKDVIGEELAGRAIKSPQVVDAYMEMQTTFVPEEKTVQVNKEGAFMVANLTDNEARKIADMPEVLDVVDDIKVFALDEPAPEEPMPLPQEDLDAEAPEVDQEHLLLDPADTEALKADAFPEWDGEEDLISRETLTASTQVEPAGIDQIALLEQQLAGELPEELSNQIQKLPIPKDKLMCIIKSVLGCLLEGKSELTTISDEHIESFLRNAGLSDESTVQAARDVILWNIQLIYAHYAWRYSTGTGVRVAVVDTGIDPSHPDLRVYGGVSYVPGVASWRDDHGHGTHVAGTIAALWNRRGIVGVAPYARLYAVKVLNSGGSGYLSWILNGLVWCYRCGMHVVNLSLGSLASSHSLSDYNRAYEQAGLLLRRRGILCVAAAGNSGHTSRPYVGNPARCPSYMAVAAIDSRRRRAYFSSYGPQVEIAAPGVNIISTIPGGRYGSKSGTSMAAPQHPSWHGDRIRVHMWRTALDLGVPGRDWLYGYGQVNAWRAVTAP
jgi:subtilisin family serine protease